MSIYINYNSTLGSVEMKAKLTGYGKISAGLLTSTQKIEKVWKAC